MLFCFEGHPIKKISIVMVLYPIVVALNFMSREISEYMYFALSQNNFMGLIVETVVNGIRCVVWFLIYKMFKNRIQKPYIYVDKKSWLLIDAICFAPLISIFSAIINTPFGKEQLVYLIAFACIITSLGIILLIEYVVDSVKVHMENYNLKLEYSYYKELEENQKEIRKLRHDMNSHLSVIDTFLENENLQESKNYLSSLLDKFKVSNRVFCSNSIINAVINSKYNLAIQNEIQCFLNIDISEIIPINDIDLCSIFANTLDNAIDASQKVIDPSKREIVVKARCNKGYFSYNIINNFNSNVTVSKGVYLTDKPDKKMNGYGIKIVKDIVKKYNGTLEITHADNRFSVLIAIKLN
jgi:hypothetical protein